MVSKKLHYSNWKMVNMFSGVIFFFKKMIAIFLHFASFCNVIIGSFVTDQLLFFFIMAVLAARVAYGVKGSDYTEKIRRGGGEGR